jgi:hypothetical protein
MSYQKMVIASVMIALFGVVAWLATGMHGATHWECKRTHCETQEHCYGEGQNAQNSGPMTCKEGKCYDAFEEDSEEEDSEEEDSEAPTRWESCYEFGLTPSRFYIDGVLPFSGGFFGLALLFWILGRRQEA